MTYKELKDSQKQELIEMINKGYVSTVIGEHFGIPDRTARSWRQKVKKEFNIDVIETKDYDIVSDDKKQIFKLKEEVKNLKKSLNDAKVHVTDSDEIHNLIFGVKEIGYNSVTIPKWVNQSSNKHNSIVPTFCLSDIHIGSVIEASDVNYVNEYNIDVAKQRIFLLVDDFIDMYINKLSNYDYPGCVIIFGGDMIENAMHGTEEINDLTVINQVIETVSILIEVVDRFLKVFDKIFIPAVSGNHGRLIADKYTKNANRLEHSLEKIVYHFIGLHFKDNKNVSLVTKQSDIVHFAINGLRFRLEHGDSIKFSGQAISGPLNSWERARLKRSGVDSAVGKSFDILIFGHFHQHMIQNKMIAMDSTKGYDPYVMRMSLPFSLPGVTSFAVNHRGEIIFATNLKCRDEIEVPKKDKVIELF